MMSLEMTREKFVSYIKDVENAMRFQDELHDFYHSHGASDPYGMPDCVSTVIRILDDLLSPVSRDVSYFIYELNFGKEYTEGCVEDNGVNIDFSTAESLYDYLTKNKVDPDDSARRSAMGIKIDLDPSDYELRQFKKYCLHYDEKLGTYYYDGTQNHQPHPGISVDFELEKAYQVFLALGNYWGRATFRKGSDVLYLVAKHWEEDYQIVLTGISHDTASFRSLRALTEDELDDILSTIKEIQAEILGDYGEENDREYILTHQEFKLWWD